MWWFSSWRLRRELDERSSQLVDPALQPTLSALARALGVDRINVHIYEIEPVNGLAAPDGRVFITRGFYAKFLERKITAEELASVVAHELGHVHLGHSRRRMIDFTGQNALRMVMASVLGRFLPGIGPYIANMAMRMVSARLSRRDEFEADAYATALLLAAGLGTAGQKSLFGKLNALTGTMAAGPPAWLRSHPKAEVRIAAIEANEAKWL